MCGMQPGHESPSAKCKQGNVVWCHLVSDTGVVYSNLNVYMAQCYEIRCSVFPSLPLAASSCKLGSLVIVASRTVLKLLGNALIVGDLGSPVSALEVDLPARWLSFI